MANKVNFQIGFTTDKAGLNELNKLLNDISIKSKLDPMNEGLKKAAGTARELSSILEKSFNKELGTLNVTKFNQALSKSNITVESIKESLSMAGTIGATAFNRLGSTVLSTNVQLKESSKLLDNMMTTMKNTVRFGISSMVFNEITNSIQKAYNYSLNLNKSLNDIRIVTGASAESMNKFAEQANTAAKNLGANTLDYTNAALIYYQQGLSEEETRARAETTVKVANVTGQRGEEVSEQLTAIWNGYKVSAQEAELYIDKVAKVAAGTAADLEELSTGMSKTASAANAMGVDFDNLNAMIATVVSVTREAPETIGTSFRSIFSRLTQLESDGTDEFGVSLTKVTEEIESMGVHILDENNKLKDMDDILQQVAGKWNTWSKAQQVAAARAIAGTQQYSRFIALMDNQDMWKDALDMSKNALGELDAQNSIFLEGTEAKLNKLKATWQDLYKGIIDDDELGAGIDIIRELVQVTDNFFDSFGGGLKSLAGLGTIISNIFNKQIGESISTAILNQKKYSENVDLLKEKIDFMNQKAMDPGQDASPQAIATKANYETQIEYAEKIFQIQKGISSEQYNNLTNLQQEIGQLEEQATLLEQQANDNTKRLLSEQEYQEVLRLENTDITELQAIWGERIDDAKLEVDLLKEEEQELKQIFKQSQQGKANEEQRKDYIYLIKGLIEKENSAYTDRLKALTKGKNLDELDLKEKEKILKTIKQIILEEEKNVENVERKADAVEKEYQAREKAENIRSKKQQLDLDFNKQFDYAKQADTISKRVQLITSSLSTLTTAWSSVNMLFQTWNDETASFGEKIAQTFMTAGVAIPILISSFKNLNDALGKGASVLDVLKAKKELKIAIDKKDIELQKLEELQTQKMLTLRRTENGQIIETNATKKISARITAQETVVKEANAAVTKSATAAQTAFNASLLANPLTWIIVALGIAVAGYSAYTSAVQQAKEAEEKRVEKELESVDTLKAETDALNNLYNTYIKAYSIYQKTGEGKEKLITASEELAKALDMEGKAVGTTTQRYKEYLKAREEEQKKTLQQKKDDIEAAKQLGQESGLFVSGKKDTLTFKEGWVHEFSETDIINDIIEEFEKQGIHAEKYIKEFGGVPFKTAEAGFKFDEAQDMSKVYEIVKKVRSEKHLDWSKTDAELDESINEYLQKYEGRQEKGKTAINTLDATVAAIASSTAQLTSGKLEADISDMKEYRDYIKIYKETLKKTFSDNGIIRSEEEIDKITKDYLKNNDILKNYAELETGKETVVGKFRKETQEEIKKQLNTLTSKELEQFLSMDINKMLAEGTISQYIAQVKSSGAMQKSTSARGVLDVLSLGDESKLDKDQKQFIKDLEEEYEELAKIRDRTSYEYLQQLRKIKEQEETNAREGIEFQRKTALERLDLQEKELQELQEQYEDAPWYKKDFIALKITAKTDEIEEILDELENTDHTIKMLIDADLASDVEDAFGLADKLDQLKNAVQNDLTYTFEEAQDLINKGYGEMFTGAKEMADNTIQVNKQVMNAFIDDKQNELEADKQSKIQQLENQKTLLQAQKDALVSKLGALQQAAVAENEVDAATALQKAQNSEKEYQAATEALNASLKDEAEGATEEENINADLFNDLGGMYEKDTKNQQQAEIDATNIQAREIQTRINNAKALHQAYASVAAQVKASENGEQTPFIAGGTTYGGGTKVTGSESVDKNIITTKGITAEDLKSKGLFDDNGATNTYKNTINALIKATQSQINGIEAQIGAADAGIAALRSAGISLDKAQREATPGGSKGGSGGKGSGSKQDPDTMEALEDEKDLYHDIDIILQQITTDLDRLEKQQDKLFGQDLVENLNKQLGKLEEHVSAINEKIRIARGEAAGLQSQLAGQGVTFNADGTISNYSSAYNAQLNYVNSIIAQYNSMSKEAQESFKDTVENAKKNFDTFVSNIDKYDALITDTIPGLEDDIQDALDKEIEINISKFNMEIEIRLDMAEAERDWNAFKKKVIDGIKDSDILGNAKASLQDFFSYYKETGEGIIQVNTKHIEDTLSELRQMDATGSSSVYGDNRTAALEDLKNYNDQLMSDLENMVDLVDEIKESYLDMMDEASEKFEEQLDMYEQISSLIEHDMNVIQLVYGEEAYSKLSAYYQKQENNFNQQLDFQRQQVDFWQKQMDTLEEGSEEWKKAKEEWLGAVQEWNDSVENAIQNLQDKYLNAINEIFQELNNKVTDGLGLGYIGEQWELINKNADQYLDTINSMYAIQQLQKKYQDAIDKTDNVSQQRKLNQLMNEEIRALEEQDKLTQYDVDRAELKYQIALKQIALQESQQNKSTMRLRRDSQGNYSYQYAADNDQVSSIQDEISNLYNQLYNMDVDRYRDNLDQIYSVWEEFQEKMAEAAQINDPEARAEKELLLKEQYGELINGLVEQNEEIRTNIYESSFLEMADLYKTDYDNFASLAQDEKDLMVGDMIPQWESGVQQMANAFGGEEGFYGVCSEAFEKLEEATKDYEQDLQELQQSAGQDFSEIANGIDYTIIQTQDLLWNNQELISSYQNELNAIQAVISELNNLIAQYKAAETAAKAATAAAYGYWQAQQQSAAKAASKQSTTSGGAGTNGATGIGSAGGGANGASGGTGGKGAGSGDGVASIGDKATLNGSYYYDSFGTSPAGSLYSGVTNGVVIDMVTNNPYGIHIHSADGKYGDLGWVKRSQLSGYDTGGYTGNWGDSSGKLALLHKKELVLNAGDTENMLNMLEIMRGVTQSIDSNMLMRIAGMLSGVSSSSRGIAATSDTLEQNVHIEANFPNVTKSDEIEKAIHNLNNIASQRINRNRG